MPFLLMIQAHIPFIIIFFKNWLIHENVLSLSLLYFLYLFLHWTLMIASRSTINSLLSILMSSFLATISTNLASFVSHLCSRDLTFLSFDVEPASIFFNSNFPIPSKTKCIPSRKGCQFFHKQCASHEISSIRGLPSGEWRTFSK